MQSYKDEAYYLYRECFPEDSEACSDFIFENSLNYAKKMTLYDEGELRCVMWLVDKTVSIYNKEIVAPHVVGLATDPKHRYKGYAKKLLADALNTVHAPFITLYPFSHAFYERFGFTTVSYDFPTPVDEPSRPATDKEAIETYASLCKDLDFYNIRTEKEFAYYRGVYGADGGDISISKYGLHTPDGFIPSTFARTGIKGVMARVVDLESLIKVSEITITEPLTVVDDLVARNNLTFVADRGNITECDKGTLVVTASEIISAFFGQCQKLYPYFPPLRGFLADKY